MAAIGVSDNRKRTVGHLPREILMLPRPSPSLVPRPSNGSSTRCNNKGCNWGGAKSGSEERGPGAWGYPKSVPYASIPAYEECLITDHKYVIAVLHSTAHSAIYLLTHEPELVGIIGLRQTESGRHQRGSSAIRLRHGKN